MTDCNCEYCRRLAGPIDRTKDRLITFREFCLRAGNRSHMWPRRRAADPSFKFPPIVRQGRLKALWESDAMAWLASHHSTGQVVREAA
jgi:hypothetical protein